MATISEGVLFESTALGHERLVVRSLRGVDRLNEPYEFHLRLEIPSGGLDDDELRRVLEAPARILFTERGVELNRYSGVIAELTSHPDPEHTKLVLDLTLVPRLWSLGLRRGSEIFLRESVPEVIARKLVACGLVADRDFVMNLREEYSHREFVAQHEETDLAFVSRLCEHVGIVMFFQESEHGERAVFTDWPEPFADIARPNLKVRQRAEHPAAFDFKTTLRRVPADVQSHDYNYRAPLLSLREAEPLQRAAAVGQWTEFGAHSKTTEETKRMARTSAEELASRIAALSQRHDRPPDGGRGASDQPRWYERARRGRSALGVGRGRAWDGATGKPIASKDRARSAAIRQATW